MQLRGQDGLKGMIDKILPILTIKEQESYINYPDDYDESYEENQTFEKNNLAQVNQKLSHSQQKLPKTPPPKREESLREDDISKKLFDYHNAILNMNDMIQGDVDD